MVTKVQIRSQFDLMNELTIRLIEELKECEFSKAEYYQLPDISSLDEKKVPETISVSKISGELAQKSILNSFSDIYTKSGLSSRVLKRHPGILVIKNADKQALNNRIAQVNKAKAAFKECILAIDNNDARFEAVHNAIPNLITLAAYALEMLEKSAGYRNPRMIDQQKWQTLVAQEQLRVSSLAEKEKLRIRRPTRVSPQVNVRYTAQNRYHVSAALPFILINPEPDVKLGILPNYEKPLSHPRKRDYDFLVDRLYLEQVDK